jgi:hypothetical protein
MLLVVDPCFWNSIEKDELEDDRFLSYVRNTYFYYGCLYFVGINGDCDRKSEMTPGRKTGMVRTLLVL